MSWVAAIPYIIKINKTNIDKVTFEENGNVVETISLTKNN